MAASASALEGVQVVLAEGGKSCFLISENFKEIFQENEDKRE